MFNLYSDIVFFKLNDDIIGGLFSSKIRYANKISIIFHNGTDYSKQYTFDILCKLLNQFGYIIEASDDYLS
jgi:hypothetical protein